jgi:hypothetical protein
MEHNGHELEVDRFRTRRYRDVWVLACSRCGLVTRVGMRERAPMAEKVARLGLDPCPGKPRELPERPEPVRGPRVAEGLEPMEIAPARIFGLDYRYGGQGDNDD